MTAELSTIDRLEGESIEIECEPPSRHVNEYTGTLKYGNEKVPLGNFFFCKIMFLGNPFRNESLKLMNRQQCMIPKVFVEE